MFCPKCAQQLPDGANFCMQCGQTVRTTSPQRWQYKNHTIRFNVSAERLGRYSEVFDRCEDIVLEELRRLEQEGWEPEGSTDWASLWAAGRVKWSKSDFEWDHWPYTYESVTVRLKRLVVGGDLDSSQSENEPVHTHSHTQPHAMTTGGVCLLVLGILVAAAIVVAAMAALFAPPG